MASRSSSCPFTVFDWGRGVGGAGRRYLLDGDPAICLSTYISAANILVSRAAAIRIIYIKDSAVALE